MSKLNFDFPTVRDIATTKKRHAAFVRRVKGFAGCSILFLDDYSDDDLFEAIFHERYSDLRVLRNYSGTGQKFVRGIKTEVNQFIRSLINQHLKINNLPVSWSTAYYLVHQKAIDLKMKQTSILLFEELV